MIILLTACGGDDDEEGGTTAATTGAAEANGGEEESTPTDEPSAGGGNGGSGGNGGNGGSGEGIDACALLTDAEVAEVLGAPVQGAPEDDAAPFSTCYWEPGGLLLVLVSVFSGDQEQVDALFESGVANSEEVEGLGDKASYNGLVKGVEVVEGNTDVTVQVVTSEIDEKQAAIDLAEKVLDRLP